MMYILMGIAIIIILCQFFFNVGVSSKINKLNNRFNDFRVDFARENNKLNEELNIKTETIDKIEGIMEIETKLIHEYLEVEKFIEDKIVPTRKVHGVYRADREFEIQKIEKEIVEVPKLVKIEKLKK